jgi:histidinol-phosphate aminotransferase
MKALQELVRENIWALKPYSCARDEFKGRDAHVFLDANESPYNQGFNRYPDPLQESLKTKLSRHKGVHPSQIFLGNGSDEAIDLVYRIFCEPHVDNVVAISPTYGMYEVCADINAVEYRKVSLDADFQLNAQNLLAATDDRTKVIWICTPNNPTGNDLDARAIQQVLEQFGGIVVVDEAYSDFSSFPAFRTQLHKYPNLIVLNTMSKAWASASIRMGMAFASAEIIALFNKVKYPYNINKLTQDHASALIDDAFKVQRWVAQIKEERAHMIPAFNELPVCLKVYPTGANFFLAKVTDADAIYHYLVDRGVIVRNRNRVEMCQGCLRITIGTPQENNELLSALRQYK